MPDNLIVGRGAIWFDRWKTEDFDTNSGELYMGNTPGFSWQVSAETLEHFSSDYGFKEKDESATMSISYNGTLTTDNISDANLAMFFGGRSSMFSIGPLTGVTSTLTNVGKGQTCQIGVSTANPSGIRKVTTVSVTKGVTPLVLGTDYTLDADLGRVTLLTGGSVVTNGDSLTVTYSAPSQTRARITSGRFGVTGSLRYIANNAQGANRDMFFPYVKLTPSGDFNMKGDSWQELTFNVEAMKKDADTAVLYIDGRPA